MEWYYAEGQERRGPVSENELQSLIAAGRVTPDTRVWNQSFTDWRPLRDTALGGGTAAGPGGVARQRCFITGKIFPTSQIIQTEHGWVSAEARDTYYQCLREGAPFPVPEGMSNARADGKKFVVPLGNPVLPRRCVKTNQPVGEEHVKRKTFYWCTPWVYLTILLSIIVVIVLYYVLRKRIPLDVPLTAQAKDRLRTHGLVGAGVTFLGLAFMVAPIVNGDLGALLPIGIILLLGGLIYASVRGTLLRAVKMTENEVWFTGACPEFLASLPPYGR